MRQGEAAWRLEPLGALLLGFLLSGCAIPREVNPVLIYNRVSGKDDAARPAPPGMDQPSRNLGMIPPRPDRPPPGAIDAVSAALAEDRARSREPLAPRTDLAPPAAQPSPGDPPVPAAPPEAPALAAAVSVPWTASIAPGAPATPAPNPVGPDVPAAPPAAPPPELLGLPRSP